MTREEAIRIIEEEIHIDVRCCTHEDVCRFEDALRMAIAALREQPQWISVEDRLPEESTEVLSFFCVRKIDGTWERYTATAIRLCDAKWLVSDYQNGIEAYSWGTDIEDCCFRVTHWMSLPEPPEVEV